MTVIEVLGGLSALVIVVLVYAVWTLRADVQALSRILAAQPSATAAPPPAPHPAPIVEESPVRTPPPDVLAAPVVPGSSQPPPAEPVPVITRLADPAYSEDELQITRARVASVTLARPLIKVAAFSYGVRRALDDEQRMRISWAMRKEFRRQRKLRRRRRAHRAPSEGWRP